MMFRKNIFIKRIMVLFLAFVLTFNTNAFYVFANSLDNVEETVENNVGEAEDNVGEAISFPDEDAEEPEEDIVDEEESRVAEVESGVAEDESNVEESEENKAEETEENKVEETEENNVGEDISFPEEESTREYESTAEEEESNVDDDDIIEIATDSEIERVEELEESEEVLEESIEVAAEETVVNAEILNGPGDGGGGRVKFDEATEQIKDRDYTLDGRTEITKVTTTKTVTAPTVTIASSESSKLSFSYWYNAEKNIKFNSGEAKALGNNAPSGILSDGDPYRNFTPVFNDTRPVMSIQIKDQYLGYVVFGYDKRNYGFYEGSENYIIRRKLALTSADFEGLKSGLAISPGYAFYRIVNSSGNEVDPTQWNRSSNVTYYLELKDNKKKIYYRDSTYNSTFSKQQEEVYEGFEYTLPTLVSISYEATNDGQEFLGWKNTTTNEFSEPGTKITFSGDADVVYEAEYSDKKFLNYDLKGHGNPIDRVGLDVGQKLVKPTDPTSESHDFKGWYHDYDLTQAVNFNNDVIGNTNKTIYAKWEEKEFTITLNVNNGVYADGYTAPTKRKYSEGATLPTSANITKVGSAFGGWYENADFSGSSVTSIAANTASNKTLYLKWNENEYNITLNNNGGTYEAGYTAPTKRKYSDVTTLPTNANIMKTGYIFVGWYESADFQGSTVTSIAANTSEDKTYYLKWKENEYSITLNINGGSYESSYTAPTKRKYTEVTVLPTDANITKLGHEFAGWYENADFSGSSVTTIPANTDSNKTYYLKWTPETYNITYVKNGGTIQSGEVTSYTYGVGATLPTDVVKSELEKFIGWYETDNFSGSIIEKISKTDMGHKTYYAKYGSVYYVTYNPGEGSGTMAKKPVEEGKTYIVPDCEFTHESLVFDKWEGSDGNTYTKGKKITLTSDLTLTALWKEKPKYNPSGKISGGISSGFSSGSGSRSGGRISKDTILGVNNQPNTHKWKYENGKWFAENLIDGSKVKDSWLYMNYNGSNGWYYFDTDGNLLTRWRVIGDKVYYFEDKDPATYGMMYTGERVVEGKKRLFDHNGAYIRDLE